MFLDYLSISYDYDWTHTNCVKSWWDTHVHIRKFILQAKKSPSDIYIYSSKDLESTFIELLIPNKQNYIIGTAYKNPAMQHFKFNELMKNLLAKINHKNKKSIITGDFNLNLLKYTQRRGIHEFLECLLYKNFLPQITLPTRITQKAVSLIDNIFTNNNENKCYSGNITTSISDHLPQFLAIEDFYNLSPPSTIDKLTFWDFKNLNQNEFEKHIKSINWSLATKNNNLNLGLETFLCLFDKMLDKHAHFKTFTKKKSHTCEEGGAHLRIFFWHLLMNLKNKNNFKNC